MGWWSRREQAKRLINVGLDFGTSSSKVIWRDVTGDRLTLLGFDNGTSGYPPICMPSSVKIAGDRIFFGSDAEENRDAGWLVRSLKVCVACRANAVSCRDCQPAGDQKRPGEFVVTSQGQQPLNADELAALLVGYTMGTAKKRIQDSFRQARDADFTWNMSAPLDQYEFAKLRVSFERLAYQGSLVAGDVTSGMRLREAVDLVRENARRSMPSRDDLPISVVPEAIAAVHAYCQSPIAAHGLYALVDVGAGTTTVSFFRYHDASSKSITCYSSCTDAVGADDLDRAIFAALVRNHRDLELMSAAERTAVLHDVRTAKENLSSDLSLGGRYQLSQAEVLEAIRPLAFRIFGVYVAAFRKAYAKEKFSDRWKSLTIMLVGGGSLVPLVTEAFGRAPHDMIERRRIQTLELPAGIRIDCGPQRLSVDDTALLSVAFGLSHPRVDIPDYWETKEVEPIGPAPATTREPDYWRE
jgi:hypothetical protein